MTGGGRSRGSGIGSAYVRDRVTILAYGALAAYTYCLYALGPILAFLRAELGLSYALAGLHSSLWAAGTIATGLLFDRFARRVGRRRLLWLSAGGTVIGALLFVAGHAVVLTLLAATVLGTSGTLMQTDGFGVLSDRHAGRRDRALVEGTIAASVVAVAAPIVLGRLADTAAGWRAGLLVPVLMLAVLFAVFREEPLPDERPSAGEAPSHGSLPAGYWLLAVLVAVAVAIEFCVVFYAAQLLNAADGLSTATAASALGLQYGGILVGRVLGSRLTRRSGRAFPLVLAALAVTATGFLAFWLTRDAKVASLGLFVTGLGVANLYPLSLSLALGASGGRTDAATARTQVLAGVAVLCAPFALGALADGIGVLRAFAMEPALIVLALGLLLAGRAMERC